jgi:3-isopropylmalate/(R)-2-methylmalate dehydratase small subunit
VRVVSSGQVLQGKPLSAHAIEVIEAGGGFNLLRQKHGTDAPAAAPSVASA